jgi:hypothetical protein
MSALAAFMSPDARSFSNCTVSLNKGESLAPLAEVNSGEAVVAVGVAAFVAELLLVDETVLATLVVSMPSRRSNVVSEEIFMMVSRRLPPELKGFHEMDEIQLLYEFFVKRPECRAI